MGNGKNEMSWDDGEDCGDEVMRPCSSSPCHAEKPPSSCSHSVCSSNAASHSDLVDKEIEDDGPPAPNDTLRFVYLVVLLNGIGTLLPWNMFITIAPQYYVKYWFTENGTSTHYANSFMASLGITSQVPNFIVSLLNIFNIIRGPLMYRIMAPLLFNCSLVCVILAFAIFVQPSPGALNWFYIVNLIIIMAMNGSNGLYQYTNALVVGSNICGTFTALLSIMATLAFQNSPQTVAIIYFSISLAVLAMCFISLILVKANPFYTHYVEKGNRVREMRSVGQPELSLSESIKQFLKGFLEAIKHSYLQLLSVWLVFFVTLSCFPTILVGFNPTDHNGNWSSVIKNPDIFYGVEVFLNFNFFAALGSTAASYIQFPGPSLLIIPCLIRIVFIPFFAFSNYIPTGYTTRSLPVLYKNEWVFFFGNAIMALTSGYFSSLGMMYAPRVVPPRLSKFTGQASALALVGGMLISIYTTTIMNMERHMLRVLCASVLLVASSLQAPVGPDWDNMQYSGSVTVKYDGHQIWDWANLGGEVNNGQMLEALKKAISNAAPGAVSSGSATNQPQIQPNQPTIGPIEGSTLAPLIPSQTATEFTSTATDISTVQSTVASETSSANVADLQTATPSVAIQPTEPSPVFPSESTLAPFSAQTVEALPARRKRQTLETSTSAAIAVDPTTSGFIQNFNSSPAISETTTIVPTGMPNTQPVAFSSSPATMTTMEQTSTVNGDITGTTPAPFFQSTGTTPELIGPGGIRPQQDATQQPWGTDEQFWARKDLVNYFVAVDMATPAVAEPLP
ncbi:hypothetical protein WR25_24058 [Diploscapter pachys]|uniref:Uncharacterized protein n=1 Tax=Diploscapter pachys TaxID=2018661 RepID=A0A2A2LBC5_9BILA|nr:hypothetical protein WR25_24058 [Diploscapter pachys]